MVSVLWFTFLHPKKAMNKDKLGVAVMAVSQVARPALFVVFGGTTFLQGFLLNMFSFWITSKQCKVGTHDQWTSPEGVPFVQTRLSARLLLPLSSCYLTVLEGIAHVDTHRCSHMLVMLQMIEGKQVTVA